MYIYSQGIDQGIYAKVLVKS